MNKKIAIIMATAALAVTSVSTMPALATSTTQGNAFPKEVISGQNKWVKWGGSGYDTITYWRGKLLGGFARRDPGAQHQNHYTIENQDASNILFHATNSGGTHIRWTYNTSNGQLTERKATKRDEQNGKAAAAGDHGTNRTEASEFIAAYYSAKN